MKKIAHGVFCWDGDERRSDRYGGFMLSNETYGEEKVAKPFFDSHLSKEHQGKRVRLLAKVVANRSSGHVGDLFLQIKPSMPEVGEEVDLGVGIYAEGKVSWTVLPVIELHPGDGRDVFWIDPRKFYRLHDQTVDIFIEETDASCSSPPDLKNLRDTGDVVPNGDGSVQSKTTQLSKVRLLPNARKIGDGLFILEPQTLDEEGVSLRYTKVED